MSESLEDNGSTINKRANSTITAEIENITRSSGKSMSNYMTELLCMISHSSRQQ